MNRKVIALFLTLVMVFSLTGTVWAAETQSGASTSAQTEPVPEEEKPEQPALTAALEIDTEHIYEGMDKAYENGYIPKIQDGAVEIVLPLKSTEPLRNNQLKAALDLGTGETPFVAANYEKLFPLETVVPQNGGEAQQLYLVSFRVSLADHRSNGTYPVTVRLSAYDSAGQPVTMDYTVFVAITDGPSEEPPAPPAISEPEKPTAEPVVFIASSTLEPGAAMAGEPFTLKLTLQNSLSTKSVENLLVTVAPENLMVNLRESSNVIPIKRIAAGGSTTLELHFDTDPAIPAEKQKINFHFQYDSNKALGLSSEGSYILDVRQGADLSFDGATLPVKVFQEDTVTTSVNLMNTGKSTLYNCRVDYQVEGLSTGGTTFVGELPAGESKLAPTNLRVSKDQLGEVTGTVTITYEDAFGQEYTKTADLSTSIVEKPAPEPEEEQKEDKKNPLWWLFILLGLAAGGGLGFGIPWFLKDRKQRQEDDLRL